MARSASFPRRAGRWEKFGSGKDAYRAFLPRPLPPAPPLSIHRTLQTKLETASLAVGRLDGIGRLLPDPDDFLYSYVRKEAVLSSQIEGTQSSLADLVLHEHAAAPGVAHEDVEEVSNYVAAMNEGVRMLARLPLSLRLIRTVHDVLMRGARGGTRAPGEFRRIQNWIGGASPVTAMFVPPSPNRVLPAMAELETFLHASDLPTLLKAGLAHAQFETIHPFLDGNGRVGRMLIPLILVAEGVLARPWLYVSLHFKRHRSAYYELLQRVRTHGAWEEWLEFYLDGIATAAVDAVERVQRLLELFERDRERVASSRGGTSIYQRVALHSNLEIFEYLRRSIVTTIPGATDALGTSKPTVARALDELERIGIAREVTGRKRGRLYVYQAYMDILNSD